MEDSDLSNGHLFHHGLSNEELEDSMDAGDQCVELIERYVRHKEEGQIIDPVSRAARELYPPLVDEEELSSLLLWYLDELEQAVQAVNGILASTE
ncbi:hypothetical protein PHLCEN_2v7005 [Hermanssonia centrifuga]|uniref:Uncharacterized protein n=1 Tax=Hermanssonia centrifuga TaxID=98765 RepID=A0A2R6NXP4_9APHY|nr:hypothetical protein PHLCEN_2v7005 [Hermanssonia centrifuga]